VIFKNVLFPVDFSERSRAAVLGVRAVVERFHAALTLIHLVEVPATSYGTPEAPVMFDFPVDDMKKCAEQRLAEFAATEFGGVKVHILVGQGEPGYCIPELARMSKVDLIMMPTRGLGKFRAMLLGSVTAKVLHDATCAVWTEGHCEDLDNEHVDWQDLHWQNIVVALDTNAEGLRLIRVAAQLEASFGCVIRLVHSVPVAEVGAERYFDLEFAAFLEDQARKTICGMQKEAGTHFEVCVRAGNVPNTVREEALCHKADLVLIGRGAGPHFAGHLRSHAYAIVRDMPCPVLSN
jgi:nucleotide-binding universal stress UspA family protein